jgi:hypothetical protein
MPARSFPSTASALWRIGDWDATPLEFMNGAHINVMHPSDVRNITAVIAVQARSWDEQHRGVDDVVL